MSENFEAQDERRHDFFIIDNQLIDTHGAEIGAYGIAVYAVLVRHTTGESNTTFISASGIAKKLGCSISQVRKSIKKLKSCGIIRVTARHNEDGSQTSNLVTLRNKSAWFHPTVTPPLSHSDTPPYHNVTPPLSHSDTEKDQSKKTKFKKTTTTTGGSGEIHSFFQNNFHLITQHSANVLNSMIDDYPHDWIMDAMKIAIEQNVRKLRYVEGVLKRWKRDGRSDAKPEQAAPIDDAYGRQLADFERRMSA